MDFAYDHIAERTYSGDRAETPKPPNADETDSSTSHTPQPTQAQRPNLQDEFQETFKAFSNSQWGVKLGGWWSTASKQAESYYETARKEAEKREAEASKAFEGVRKTVVERTKTVIEATEDQLDNLVNEEKKAEQQKLREQQQQETPVDAETSRETVDTSLEDNETFINRFKSEAAKRLKEVQKAEDAADEALLRFGTNLRNFLRDAVSITAPEPSTTTQSSEVLFESKDATTGKRVIHTSRLEAQLHVIHTTPSSFISDPDSTGSEGQWEDFKKTFDIDKKTEAIAKDLETYNELRSAMETLVPEQVEYKDFWARYCFLRHVVEMQEVRRKEMLKASASKEHEEVAWDEDSDNEDKPAGTSQAPQPRITETIVSPSAENASNSTSKTLDAETMTLKPSRRSHDEKSVADSDASYDLVSGAASQAAGSPKEKPSTSGAGAGDDSDEDWE